MTVTIYTPDRQEQWDAFVRQARGNSFLFERSYMDYHSDRFADNSLMVSDEGAEGDGALLAVMPANRDGDTLYSHQGLTYGGLLTGTEGTARRVIDIFQAVNTCLRSAGIRRVVYKALPWIYHSSPAEEDLYALFKVCRARLVCRDISTVISKDCRLPWSRDRRYSAHRALRDGVTVGRSDDYEAFWPLLTDNLLSTHGVRPVHSLEEIRLLSSRFPDNIILYTAVHDGRVVAGTVLYVTANVVHAQYMSAGEEGKRLRALDAIIDRVLNDDFADAPFFDFGRSTEGDGTRLNTSLIYQKEGFGGRAVCYDTYEYELCL